MTQENRNEQTNHQSPAQPPSSKSKIKSPEDLSDPMEPKVRQQIKVVGRSIFCFKCEGEKELASYYCPCGLFVCALHLVEHSCLVSASMQYNAELLEALS